jgi:hypothetical protein
MRTFAWKSVLPAISAPSVLFAAALASALSTGCAGLAGEEEVESGFPVRPTPDGSFFGWTEITISADANDAERATLVSARLDVADPSQASDLSFLRTLKGEVVLDTERTLVVDEDSFPKGERPVGLNIVYGGDLRPFFKDGHTIRLEWTGLIDPSFSPWPAEGIDCKVSAKVDVE